jgi:imidazolonepropionase-like amidohydrolase
LPDVDRNIRTFLFAGVTTMVDLGGGIGEVTQQRDAIAAGEEVGPRMLVSGPHFTAPDSHPVAMLRLFVPWIVSIFLESGMAYQVGSVDDVVALFDDFLEYKPDVVKITSDQIPLGVPTIAPGVAHEVVARAHAAGLKVFAHVGDNADAQKVANAGVDILAHGIYRERISEATAKLLAEKGVKVTPTLAVYDHIDRLASGDYQLSPMQLAVGDKKTVAAIQAGPGDYKLPAAFDGWTRVTREHRAVKFENVAVLRAHGVPILVGSDSPNIGQFGGASLHDEMDLLVQAGMTPAEVLRAATYENAKALGRDKEIGTIEVGKVADLVLVNGDPVEDIAAVHAIESVYLGGNKVERTIP